VKGEANDKPPLSPADLGVDVEADARKFRMFIVILLALLLLGAIALFVTIVLETQFRGENAALGQSILVQILV
jgi:hypothetical protein